MRLPLLSSLAVAGVLVGQAPAQADAACALTRAPAAGGGVSGGPIAPGTRYEEVAVRCPADAGFLGPATATTAHTVEVDLAAPAASPSTRPPTSTGSSPPSTPSPSTAAALR